MYPSCIHHKWLLSAGDTEDTAVDATCSSRFTDMARVKQSDSSVYRQASTLSGDVRGTSCNHDKPEKMPHPSCFICLRPKSPVEKNLDLVPIVQT